jgi:hypothetical protein
MSVSSAPAVPASDKRPRLALLLALLAIPGSTIAWSLPMGGFWIGLPLAIAAIVVGVMARSDADRAGRQVVAAAVVLAAATILFQASWTVAG